MNFIQKCIKTLVSLNRIYLAMYITVMSTIDIIITSAIYNLFPDFFFKYEGNITLIVITNNWGFFWAMMYMFFMDMFFASLLIFNYKSLRILAFFKASLHFLSFNWFLIIWYNVPIIYLTTLNYFIATIALGLITYFVATDKELFEDIEKFISKLKYT